MSKGEEGRKEGGKEGEKEGGIGVNQREKRR